MGAFQCAKDFGNFGWNSNGKVHFGFFQPEYSGSPLEVVHLFRLEYSDRNSSFHFFALRREFGRETKGGKSHFYWLARFYRKMSFHFPREFPLISDRSVWHIWQNGKHPMKRVIGSFRNTFFVDVNLFVLWRSINVFRSKPAAWVIKYNSKYCCSH